MSLNAAVAIPSAWAATLGRDLLSEASRMLSPSPGLPSKLVRGTRQRLKAIAAVEEPRCPILSSVRITSKPGVWVSNTSAEIAAFSSSISAHLPNSSMSSATSPLVMKILPPSTMIASPSGVKRVFMPVASDPAAGSVMASAPSAPAAMRGSHFCFCSGLPISMRDFSPLKVVE